MYILDTDHISLLQQNHPRVSRYLNEVYETERQTVGVTVISIQEQMQGWLGVINQSRTEDRLLWAYSGLSDAVKFLNTFPVLQFDRAAYNIFLGLKSQKIRIGTQDLRIAAIALAVGGAIVTRNQQDFGKIPGLTLENWTV